MSMSQDEQLQLRRWFDAIDQDHNGQLDAEELQKALALGSLHFSLRAVGQMIRIHDFDRSGTIDFGEFQRLHAFLTNMQSSFRHFDSDKNGQLDQVEISRALHHAGFRLDAPAAQALFQSFDCRRTGAIGLPEYIGMTLFLQAAQVTFKAFDPQNTGRISLTFDQWIYAASNVV